MIVNADGASLDGTIDADTANTAWAALEAAIAKADGEAK